MEISITGANYIGYTSSKIGTTTFQTFSCKKNKLNKELFFEVTENELEEILVKAEKARIAYALLSMEKRKQFLEDIILLLEEHRKTLVQQFCQESSLSEERGNIELTRTKTQIKTYIDFISKPNWNSISEEYLNGVNFQKKLFPIGPVVVFGASNFPFAYSTIGGDTASALASGNSVIYKANPFHAGVSELVTQIIVKAAKKNHLPDGVFSLVQGQNYWIGETLVKDKRIKAVGFTGSIKGGTALLHYAKEREEPIPIFCEMGSLNPVFIFEDALETKMEEMVEKLSLAITNDAGQFCTKPGLLFVSGDKKKLLIEKLQNKVKEAQEQPMLHPSIYTSFQNLAKKLGGLKNTTADKPYHVRPIIISMTFQEFLVSKEAKEEVFGPFAVMITCENEGEMKLALQQLKGNLTASVWTDTNLSEEWMYLLTNSVGRIIKNGVSTGVAVIDSMHHGGGFPSTSDSRFTAVGKDAIYRFLHPVTIQNG